MLLLGACTNSERQGIRVARTATVEPSVRVIVDNCPGPESIIFSVRDEVLWSAENPDAATTADPAQPAEVEPAQPAEVDPNDTAISARDPGLLDVLVGTAPAGWTTTQELEQPLRDDIRYTVRTEPDGKTIEFSTSNLATRTLFDGETSSPFQPESISDPCKEPADIGKFFGDLAILGALGATSAALVMVSLITLLFVITRRFSRIRTIERRAAESAEYEAAPAPQSSSSGDRWRSNA